ncbi:alpha/beta hydrolase family protein [Larkinella knui]|uniref:Xylan esterase n=1 Tax=Larkinella knui TaxID=2025310 RepID=A0A3P1CCD9_9BACT|nr:acetylxylan esterase [Larkinella knui]RRB10494.1 xylan esterase [Larkinella knui]
MNISRNYKQAFLLACALVCSIYFPNDAAAQEDLSVFPYWSYEEGSPSTSLYRHLCQRAFRQLQTRKQAITKLKTKADWEKRQAAVRAKLQKMVGPFPAKTPLNPVITGTIQREDFTVEKLYFESRPHYYVTAALFVPKNRSGKLPAIVYCSGHSYNGFRQESYQRIMLNYVKKGFIVLAFDPIGQGERLQYDDEVVKKSAVNEHSYPGAQSFIAGLSPANYFIWDGIRSVDYLLTRSEVDPARIGIAGRSGGGTQSAYIAALDDRIVAAAPECYITTFDKLLRSKGPQDAEQNLLYGLENGIDIPDYLEVRAPKPTLIVATTMDIFSIQGARNAYQETRKAYQAHGRVDALTMVEDDAGHLSTVKNREASYAFFQKYLKNPGSPADLEVEFFKEKELFVTSGGLVRNSLQGETLFSLNQKYTQTRLNEREKRPAVSGKNLREKIIALTGYEKPPLGTDLIFCGRLHRPQYAIEKYLIKGSGNYYLPVLWLKPQIKSTKTLLLLDERGKATAAKVGEWADQLAQAGYQIILPDLSGVGELGTGFMKGGDSVIEDIPLNLWFTGVLTHKSLVAVRAEEIEILADVIKKSIGLNRPLAASAFGTLNADLLHASVLNNMFDQIVLLNPLVSYQSLIEEKHYKTKFVLSAVAGALSAYDLPDLVATLPTDKLLIINPLDASEKGVSSEETKRIFRNCKSSLNIRYDVKPDRYVAEIIGWLR